MRDVFISHVEEDSAAALEIADALETAGFSTWCYERDSVPGPSYLVQTGSAVEQSRAVVVLISKDSLGSRQVTVEIVRGHETEKPFIPVLVGLTHLDFVHKQPEWREAIGAATSVTVPREGVHAIIPRVVQGLRLLGVEPSGEIVERGSAAATEPAQPAGWRGMVAKLRRRPLWQRLAGIAIVAAAALAVALVVRAIGSGNAPPSSGEPPAAPTSTPSNTARPSGGASQLMTTVGEAKVTDVRLTDRFCPPAAFPGACKRPSSGRFLILTLTGANGGGLTIAVTQQANNSYVLHGSTSYAPSGDADEYQGVVRVVYSGVPTWVAGQPITLVWPDGQRVSLQVAR